MNSWKFCYSRLLIPRIFTRALSLFQIAVWFSLKRHMVRGMTQPYLRDHGVIQLFSPWYFVYPNILSLLLCYSIAFIWLAQSFARQYSISMIGSLTCMYSWLGVIIYFMHIVNHIIINFGFTISNISVQLSLMPTPTLLRWSKAPPWFWCAEL